MHLWAEACNTAVYVKNHCSHRVLGMSTPEEAFTGKKPDVSYFNIFGSFVYVHVTKNARKKLKATAEVEIYVGYTETPHISCVFDKQSNDCCAMGYKIQCG